MKKVLTLALSLCMTWALQAKDYHYVTVPGDMMKTRIYTLDNGLKVYLSVNKEQPRIQTYIAVKTGSRNDPAETTGLAHYLEHIMFKGTKTFGTTNYEKEAPLLADIEQRYEKYRRMTDEKQRKQAYHEIDSVSQIAAKYFIPNEYDKLMASIGALGTNAYTSNDITNYVEDIPSNEVENWAKIQSDRFQNMVIRGFHTELEAVYEEYNIGIAKDMRKWWAALNRLLFPSHPYGTQTTIGTQEHLKNPSIKNIKEYYHRYYVPNNVAICMAGDFNPEEVISIIDKYFGKWQPNKQLSQPTFPVQQPLTAVRDTTVMGLEAGTTILGWRFDGASSAQTDTVEVINEILSNGKAGLFDLNLDQKMRYLGGGVGTNMLSEYGVMYMVGVPKEGQSLEEVRDLMLEQVDLLRKGEFSDQLLQSVINNMKRSQYELLESNEGRANMMVDAFINNVDWKKIVNKIHSIEGITKEQIVAFARKHLRNDNYAIVYKQQGEDKTLKKIEKPAITPIPSNRDTQSDFVKAIVNSHTKPITPKFVNFDTDIIKGKTKKKMPVFMVSNNENGLFVLTFRIPMGIEADNRLEVATDYLNYLGTDKYTPEALKQAFYQLACDYSISVHDTNLRITLRGLNENIKPALSLLNHFIHHAKVDKEAASKMIDLIEKSRQDNKTNQQQNFRALTAYGKYGEYNAIRNIIPVDQLRKTDPQVLVDLVKGLSQYNQEAFYYGPSTLKEITKLIDQNYTLAKKRVDAPQGKAYQEQPTTQNEVLIAPYDAKNIYMMQYHNNNQEWNAQQQPVIELYNEYFGTGMNGVVFQELRETRGLAYSAGARFVSPTRVGHPVNMITQIITQNDKMMECINQFKVILDTLPQTQAALDLAKQAIIKRLQTVRITKENILETYISARTYGIDYDLNELLYKVVPTLEMKDLIRFQQQYIANKPYRYIILGDEKNLDMNSLKKVGPIKRVSTEEIFGY